MKIKKPEIVLKDLKFLPTDKFAIYERTIVLAYNNPVLITLLRSQLLRMHQLNLSLYFNQIIFLLNKKVKVCKKFRCKQNKIRIIKFLGQTSISMAVLVFFSAQVLAVDFPNDPAQAAIQEKKRLFIKRLTLLSLAVVALGGVGYLLSNNSLPFFLRLSPSLKDIPVALVLPVLKVLDVLEFMPVPEFLKIPFSLDINTLSLRIAETFDFLVRLDSHPAFLLKNHQYKALKMVTLMSHYIDNLTALGRDNVFDFQANSGKLVLVNQVFEKICLKSRYLEDYCGKLQTERLVRLLAILMEKHK